MSIISYGLIKEIFNKIDFGMILIDNKDRVLIWNDFISRHAQKNSDEVEGLNLFTVFPALPRTWLSVKFKGVRQLKNISRVSWEQRPVLFEFEHGGTMLQNCDFLPVIDPDTNETYICIIIYDVSDAAKNKMELNELIQINKSLEEISNFDALTEIYNRRFILQTLQDEIRDSLQRERSLHLCMFDLDHFKNVNDTYGHIVGDRVLKYVAKTVLSSLTEDMKFGRYGGEEFLIIFSGMTTDDVMDRTEAIRQNLNSGAVETREGDLHISASFGICEFTKKLKDDLELIHNADVALYRSKEKGRDRVTLLSQK